MWGEYAFDTERGKMKKVTGQQNETKNENKEVLETTQALIALYKREFEESWREAFERSVNVSLVTRLP
jgi:tellurite resistance protein